MLKKTPYLFVLFVLINLIHINESEASVSRVNHLHLGLWSDIGPNTDGKKAKPNDFIYPELNLVSTEVFKDRLWEILKSTENSSEFELLIKGQYLTEFTFGFFNSFFINYSRRPHRQTAIDFTSALIESLEDLLSIKFSSEVSTQIWMMTMSVLLPKEKTLSCQSYLNL